MLLFLIALFLMGTGTVAALYLSYGLELNSKQAEITALDESALAITEYYVSQAADGAVSTQQA
jgi:hypothetical protein